MFGFHTRNRSLIPIGDMEKAEKMEARMYLEGEDNKSWEAANEEEDAQTPRQNRNRTMVFLLFLAEAIMASSLSTEIGVLVPSATDCMAENGMFLRSILGCAYFFGSATGVFWGCAADRFGRRKVALAGLVGMVVCCIGSGFANTFAGFAILRVAAGTSGSAVAVSALAMLADSAQDSTSRAKVVSRLPVIAVCGGISPLVASAVHSLLDEHLSVLFAKLPGLSGEIACASLLCVLGIAEAFLLDETLPSMAPSASEADGMDSEKTAFLGQSIPTESEDSLNISIMEALSDTASNTSQPSKIGVTEMLTASSMLLLLTSYTILSVHSSAFDTLLPHLSPSGSGSTIPCRWLKPLTLLVQALAAIATLRYVPKAIHRNGLLPTFRSLTTFFPVLYLLAPILLTFLTHLIPTTTPLLPTVLTTLTALLKATLSTTAQTLALLLLISAAPDAASTGTLLGTSTLSALFRALAVSASGITYYLAPEHALAAVSGALWVGLAVIAVLGWAVTRRVREGARVGADIPVECFAWEGIWDSEGDSDREF